MAYIRKRGRRWLAEISKTAPDGALIREASSHDTKAEAMAWAAQREQEVAGGAAVVAKRVTFGDVLRRYADEVSTTKRGARWEQLRIEALTRGRPDNFPPVLPDPIASIRLADLDERHFAAWRDRRLRSVTPGTVRREWSLLSNACTVAINEWRLLDRHPMSRVAHPKGNEPRSRRPTEAEISALMHCCGYAQDAPPVTMVARVGAAILFAIETAMRAGEICGLRWQDVETARKFLRTSGKTPAARREVPLSSEALRILQQLAEVRDGDSVFQIGSASLDALYRKARARAAVDDLHFHDLRHEAITRLAKRLHVLELARAVGHRDLRMLQIYYNESAEDIAKRLE